MFAKQPANLMDIGDKIPQDIPSMASHDYRKTSITVRDMTVNLDEVYQEARRQALRPSLVSVFADTIHISRDILVKGNILLLAARRIEAGPGAEILLDLRDDQAKVLVHTLEVVGQLPVKAVWLEGKETSVSHFDLAQLGPVGALIAFQGSAPVQQHLKRVDEKLLEPGSSLRLTLATIFHAAAAAFFNQPELARSMLTWIQAATAGSGNALDLYLQSGALLAQLNGTASKVTFVPALDREVYTRVITSFVEAAQAYAAQHERFRDRELSAAERQESARLMLAHYQDTSGLDDELLKQAEANFKDAERAANKAMATFRIQQNKVNLAAIGFKYDAKIWVREEIMKAVFNMCVAVAELVAAIGLMVVGDEAAGAQAGSAVVKGTKAAEQAAKVSRDLRDIEFKFGETTQNMKDLAEAMEQLKKASAGLQKTYQSITKLMVASADMNKAKAAVDVTIPPTDNMDGQAQWDAFMVAVKELLRPAITAEVPGAQAYQNELEKLAIYGKAAMAAQTAVVLAGQAVTQLRLQKQVGVSQEKRLEAYIEQLAREAEVAEELQQLLFEREMNLRRWLFIALQNYAWAYRYWALRESRVQLSLVKPVQAMYKDLGTIDQEYAEALESFNPGPQPLRRIGITIVDTSTGPYRDAIAALRETGAMTVTVPPEEPAFDSYDRIRLSTIRVWLKGVRAIPERPLYINIASSGIYFDRFEGHTFYFAAAPLLRNFKYDSLSGSEAGIRVDGRVADREKFAYFEPTPFTQWTITVPQKHNPGVDLSKVTAVTLEFSGSFMLSE